MTILNNGGTRTSSLLSGITSMRSDSSKPAQSERKPSQYWLNVGVVIPGGGEDGEDLFVSLPGGGIALDDLQALPVKNGKNSNWKQLLQAKNRLLEGTQGLASDLKPGEAIYPEEFRIEIRRVNADASSTAAEGENPVADAIGSLFGR